MLVVRSPFFITHFFYPFIASCFLFFFIYFCSLDSLCADVLYAIQGNTWYLKNHWLAERVLHNGGRDISLAFGLLVLVLLIISCRHSRWKYYQKSLLYVVVATVASILAINLLKFSSAVSCPWEFARYGGSLAYHPVIEQLYLRNGTGCFPAGQASSGYAWVTLYFFGLVHQSSWRKVGLIVPIVTGIILGVAQQFRGAHFVSHDVGSLTVCWFISLLVYMLMFESVMHSSCKGEACDGH